MSIRLIALDKQTGVCLVRVGKTWRHIFAKILLKVTGYEATMECQYDQLRAILKTVICGVSHGYQSIWNEKSTTEDRIFLIVDAKNVFNEINRIRIL